MYIRPSYSSLLGRPWIHGAGVVTPTLHQMMKYSVKGRIVIVRGKEEYMVSHLNSFRYVEMEGEFIETPCQNNEEVPHTLDATKIVTNVLKITRPPLKMASLKDAKAIIEEGGSTI